ncbi:hypothetical protein K32_46620 [Kaistia sp. 32K]|uniref:hypothetical protein n=1 Tax=Kaistia sp. 32K TaxID=2795690 RepID=UPI001916240C|nr:hypothetical protein [Kaistia sp. 32K]BCP56045.1 hypothetical protein K32_46620 [Kaistia sp. 32K]
MTTYRTFVISGPRGATSWKDKLKLGAAMVVGAAVVFAALVVSFSIALILIPILGIVYLFRRRILRAFLARAMPPGAQPGPRPGPTGRTYETASPFEEPNPFRAPPGGRSNDGVTIDAEYHVVEPNERDGK